MFPDNKGTEMKKRPARGFFLPDVFPDNLLEDAKANTKIPDNPKFVTSSRIAF